MASFHAVRLACFDGKSTAFSKFNQGTGYRATTTRPNKVHDFSAYHFYTAFQQPDKSVPSSCFAFSKHHDRAKDFWMNQLDTCFSFYKQDLLEYFRGVLGVRFLFNNLLRL
jgi:hypothetical protein